MILENNLKIDKIKNKPLAKRLILCYTAKADKIMHVCGFFGQVPVRKMHDFSVQVALEA